MRGALYPKRFGRKNNMKLKTDSELKSIYVPLKLRGGKLNLKRPQQLILLFSAVAAVAAVIIVLVTVDFGQSYTIEEPSHQYYAGKAVAVDEESKLKRNSEDKTLLFQGENSTETFLPVYFDSKPQMILATDMMLITPRTGQTVRVSYFSEVEYDKYGTITITREKKEAKPQHGFLYDGEDFYIFLEPVTVEFNGYSMDLPALSYVEAVYGGYMMVFNYETKEFFMELSEGTGTAKTGGGDYTISLLGDTITMHDGKRWLLATRSDLFDPIV